MLIIERWSGRFGNNILQIVNAIHYAIVCGHWEITLPPHTMFTTRAIRLTGIDKSVVGSTARFTNSFGSLKELKIAEAAPAIYRAYALKYIRPILRITESLTKGSSDVVVHFRGGDIFSERPHTSYVQPPLWYYKKAIDEHGGSATFVYEDLKNPCARALVGNTASVSSFSKDLAVLLNAKHLIAGFSTFAFAIYLLNPALQTLTLPDYFAALFPAGSWGDGFTLHVIALPGYIRVGEWVNSAAQRALMLNYAPPATE